MAEEATGNKSVVVVRIRGTIRARREARETLRLLHLTRNNYAALIDNRPSFSGMLKAARGYVTWGEASQESVNMLIKKRGRLLGSKKLTGEYLQKNGFKTIEELAEAVFACRIEYWKLPNIQPAFRLRPPTKGFKRNIKKGYGADGELGYRSQKINELIKRMV